MGSVLATVAPGIELTREGSIWRASFRAMASPCELLIENASHATAKRAGRIVAECAWRIERHFSRYRDDNIVGRINRSDGRPVTVDEETARMLDYAAMLHDLSEGMFDITSGVLRSLWRFDGGSDIPTKDEVRRLLPRIGWSRVRWQAPVLQLLPGMEIDLGGIGKEYAVDQAMAAVSAFTQHSCLINFGGDLAVNRPRMRGQAWRTGVEDASGSGPSRMIELRQGALATSGDSRRFALKDGVRYSHVLNPKTGWPVECAPQSVTVAADTCTQAGMLATLGLLSGADCAQFLGAQKVRHWIQRSSPTDV